MLTSAIRAGRSVVSSASAGPSRALHARAGTTPRHGACGERWGALLQASAPVTGESKAASAGLCCAHTYGKALPNCVRGLLRNYLSL